MPNYRRAFVPGGCWFFTVNLLERSQTLLIDHVDELRGAFDRTKVKYPFEIDAIVILPDHLHAIWSLPPDDAEFSTRWRLIWTQFAKALPKRERRSAVRQKRNERGIWQRRFWEHLDPRRQRLCAACRILLLQSGQTRAHRARQGLAAFVVPPRRAARVISARLGGRYGWKRRIWRSIVGRVSRRRNPPRKRGNTKWRITLR